MAIDNDQSIILITMLQKNKKLHDEAFVIHRKTEALEKTLDYDSATHAAMS